MTRAKIKFYVVWKGRKPGVYESWSDCKQQIDGFPGAKYKSFPNKQQAEWAFKTGPASAPPKPKKIINPGSDTGEPVIWESIAVDAACSGNPGEMEYRGVDTTTGKALFHQGPYLNGTNNIGEFLAIVHALALLKGKRDQLPIYTDSRTARSWIRNKKANTKLPRTRQTATVWALINRAEKWLARNKYSNPILKWNTRAWGEIPADFGRK